MPGFTSGGGIGISTLRPGTSSVGGGTAPAPAPQPVAPPPANHPAPSVVSVQQAPPPVAPAINIPPPPTPSAATPMDSFSNTAQTDPRLGRQLDRLDERLNNPEGSTGRAIDVATSKIRDANEGRRKAVQGMLARRGVLSSSSIPEFSEASMQNSEAADVNQAATNIALQREQANDQVLLGATGAYTASGDAQRAAQALGNQQWQMAEQARQARDRAALDAWMGSINMIGAIGNL